MSRLLSRTPLAPCLAPCPRSSLFSYLSPSTRSAHYATTPSVTSSRGHSASRNSRRRTDESTPPESQRHAPSTRGNISQPPRLLMPFELSRRITSLCNKDNVDGAVELLQNSPLDAQNIKVWNTLIQQCFEAKRYKLAFRLFTDLKRRGFQPSLRTFSTMMTYYAQIDDWAPYSKQLESVNTVFDHLLKYIGDGRVDISDPVDASYARYNIALYIGILGRSEQHQRMFDVFHELPHEGPLAPDGKIFGALLISLSKRYAIPGQQRSGLHPKTVSDVKFVWRQMMRSLEKQPDIVSSLNYRAIDATFVVLSTGEPAWHPMAFDILRDFYGLSYPDKELRPPRVEMSDRSLTLILRTCNQLEKYEHCVGYFDQVMADPPMQKHLRPWHMYEVLKARIGLAAAGHKDQSLQALRLLEWGKRHPGFVKLDGASGNMALELCWKEHNWPTALAIFTLVTGRSGSLDVLEKFAGRGSLAIHGKAWCHLARTALVSDVNGIRHCLHIIETYGGSVLDQLDENPKEVASAAATDSRMMDDAFPALLVRLIERAQPKDPKNPVAEDVGLRWATLKDAATRFIARMDKPTRRS
ncbi:hypothetical protein OF83DRAFT_1049291 [Amylostereum chailletii]|nr:hypothetical protein OF83DRAFT_1049291 [Amylostereum chailletii]